MAGCFCTSGLLLGKGVAHTPGRATRGQVRATRSRDRPAIFSEGIGRANILVCSALVRQECLTHQQPGDAGGFELCGDSFSFFPSYPLHAMIVCLSRLQTPTLGVLRLSAAFWGLLRVIFVFFRQLGFFRLRYQLDGSYQISSPHIWESIQLSARGAGNKICSLYILDLSSSPQKLWYICAWR
jgi:hypothetical protein